jgi:hypothetical protein
LSLRPGTIFTPFGLRARDAFGSLPAVRLFSVLPRRFAMAFCTKCGAQVEDGVAFCTRCGQPVGTGQPAPPQYQAPAAPPPPQYQAPGVTAPAHQTGRQTVEIARKGFGEIISRMGLVTLIGAVIVWIACFLLTGFTISISFFGTAEATSSTLWNALALDPTSNMAAGSHGFLSLVVIVCILLPFAAAFIPHPLAKFLYAAPLLALVLAWATVEYEFNHMLSLMTTQMGAIPAGMVTMSTEYGTYLALLASLAVAARIVTAPKS